MTIRELSGRISIPTRTIENYEGGRNNPSVGYVYRLATYLGIDLNWLFTGEGEMWQVREDMPPEDSVVDPESEFVLMPLARPRLDAAAEIVLMDKTRHYCMFQRDWLRDRLSRIENGILIVVDSDRMEPSVNNGDTVLIDRGRNAIRSGRIFALGINDSIEIRRLEMLTDKRVLVMSDNKDIYPSYEADVADIKVIGQVMWLARELSQ